MEVDACECVERRRNWVIKEIEERSDVIVLFKLMRRKLSIICTIVERPNTMHQSLYNGRRAFCLRFQFLTIYN